MSDALCEIIKSDLKPRAKFLYHYTSISTLVNILGDRSSNVITLRATNMNCLNDPMEFITGIELMKRLKLEEDATDHDISEMISALDGRLKNTYSFSLSRNADSLPMWHMYAPYDGIAIGFDFNRVLRNLPDGVVPLECFYMEQKVRKQLDHLSSTDTIAYCEFQYCLPYIMKNGAYKHEREIRLIGDFPTCDGISYKNGLNIPFKNFVIDKNAIDRIVIGPTQKNNCEAYLRNLLRCHNLEQVTILSSQIPYRNV